jgi:hypothetical protein
MKKLISILSTSFLLTQLKPLSFCVYRLSHRHHLSVWYEDEALCRSDSTRDPTYWNPESDVQAPVLNAFQRRYLRAIANLDRAFSAALKAAL